MAVTPVLVAAAAHFGDWLQSPTIASVGLKLSDEAIRVAVAHRLGCTACEPHTCLWQRRGLNSFYLTVSPYLCRQSSLVSTNVTTDQHIRGFLKWSVLYQSTFYLLTYLLTYCSTFHYLNEKLDPQCSLHTYHCPNHTQIIVFNIKAILNECLPAAIIFYNCKRSLINDCNKLHAATKL